MVAMVTTGVDNGLIPAMVSRYTGTQGLSLIALVLVPTGYLLTWNAFFWKDFHRQYASLLILYYAMIGE